MSPNRIPTLFGTAAFGEGNALSKIHTPEDAQKYVDTLIKFGYDGLDTARLYGGGSSEKLIAQLNLGNVRVDTKLWPTNPGDHAPEKAKAQFRASVEALKGIKIRTLYLHAPDKATPYEDTLGAINELYQDGLFESFGLSNFPSYDVAEIYTITKLKGYVLPTVYQGIYNCFDRNTEAELFPALRKYNIRFAAYSPLAGGFLTGFFLKEAGDLLTNARFDPKTPLGVMYTSRYGHSIPALHDLKVIGDKHQLTLSEIAVRWLVHHSKMVPSDVGVIYGGSKLQQLKTALTDHAKGPLPEDVVQALEDAWISVKAYVPEYWM